MDPKSATISDPIPQGLSLRRPLRGHALTLRRTLREQVPFGLRVGIRRAPALLRYYSKAPWALPPKALAGAFPITLAERRSPLRRAGTTYDPSLQRAKEQNVARAAEAINGTLLPPGEIVSWHDVIGPPLGHRGFAKGPELHDGALSMGRGGGLCQVANLLLYLALMSGAEIVERHRHGLDLFPDSNRDVPFGCGATVFYPHRDLKIRNTLATPLRIDCQIQDAHLVGQIQSPQEVEWRFEILEINHRFERSGKDIIRSNTIARRRLGPQGQDTVEALFTNRAKVLYPVSPEEIEPSP